MLLVWRAGYWLKAVRSGEGEDILLFPSAASERKGGGVRTSHRLAPHGDAVRRGVRLQRKARPGLILCPAHPTFADHLVHLPLHLPSLSMTQSVHLPNLPSFSLRPMA